MTQNTDNPAGGSSEPGLLTALIQRLAFAGRRSVLPWAAGVIALALGLGQLLLDEHHPHELVSELDYLIDPDHSLTLEDALNSDQWQESARVPNFGFRPEAFWFRLVLDVAPEDATRQLLELSYPIQTRCDVSVSASLSPGPRSTRLHPAECEERL